MNTKLLIPLILVSAAAQADLAPDRKAITACENRFDRINHSQELKLRRGPVHMVRTHTRGTYQYYFNASNREQTYRVECRAKSIGKVIEFALEPGRWVFSGGPREEVASN
jgi:hypothetical protein